MAKEKLEKDIKKNYQDIQNYLEWDPWAEWFLDCLADLQTNFADYLIEILKEKKYGKNDVTKANIYQWYIRWWKYKYINNEKIEHIISNKVLWKKVSIDALVDEWIQKINDLFDTQKSFEEALEQWKIQSVQLNGIILPPDDSPAPVIWSGNWFEKKELSQNKLLLFVSALREFWIYLDDLIIYTWKIDENMMRESSYYAIFIPRENKTVFLNTWYGEATFVCDWEVSIKDMTTFWKEKLQSELWAIKINFFEQDIELWKKELKNAILWNNWEIWKKIEKKQVKEIVNRINKIIELENFKCFYEEHKDESFTDSEWNEVKISDLFKSIPYYQKNYKIINREFIINLPGNPSNFYKMTWNEFLNYLGIEIKHEKQSEIISIEDLKYFYNEHKSEYFTDSEWNEVKISDLFKSSRYYTMNYKIINKNFNLNLPGYPSYYNLKWNEFLNYLGIVKKHEKQSGIILIEDLKQFYNEHKSEYFTDSEWNKVEIKNLFQSYAYYFKNYKIINREFNLNLRGWIDHCFKMSRNKILKYLGITLNHEIQEEIMTIDNLRSFYINHKSENFTDSEWNEVKISDLFKSNKYYIKNYKIINREFNLNLPSCPDRSFKMGRNKILKYLGVSVNREKQVKITTIEGFKIFYDKYKDKIFTDSGWSEVKISSLFKSSKYYIKNYKIINREFNLNIPGNPTWYYKMSRNKILKYLGITLNHEMQTKFISIEDFKRFYTNHKDKIFTDSEWYEVKISSLFKSSKYYIKNYKIINREFNLNIPSHPIEYYKMKRNELLKYLEIEK